MNVMVVARHPAGGIKTYFRYVFGNPVMADLQVTLVTPHSNSGSFFRDFFTVERFSHEECPDSPLSLLGAIYRTIAKTKPDLVHSHGFTAGALTAVPAKILGIRHILTTHDVFFPEHFTGYKGKLKRFCIEQLLSMVDIMNPVGSDACDNLKRNFPFLEKKTAILPIRNGINSNAFLGDDARPLRSEIGISDDFVLLGFFGRFMSQKGFNLLRDAVASLNENPQSPHFGVVCFGWGGFIREEQAILKERRIEQFFYFLPGTDDMGPALRGVDAVVMPSRWEACPLLPMEAMVSGAVVIASDCIGMREVTEDTPALTFPSGNIEALKNVLVDFATNTDEIRGQTKLFRSEAATRFDASRTANELRRLYDGLAADE